MIKKIKVFIQKKRDKYNKYWSELDVERELKIEKIKNQRSKRSFIDSLGILLIMLYFFVLLPFGTFIMSKIDYENVHKTANAEEINVVSAAYQDVVNDTTAIVNFNQLVPDTYTHNYVMHNDTNICDIPLSHKFYLRVSASANIRWKLNQYTSGLSTSFDLIDNNSTGGTQFGLVLSQYDITIYNFMVVDLTQMFGAGNEPNLQQCKDLFVSDYYQYESGTAVSLSGLNSYAEGVNSAVKSYENLVASPSDFYNALQPYYYYDTGKQIYFAGSIERSNGTYLILSRDPPSDYTGNSKACAMLPLAETLLQGNVITISGYSASNQGSGSTTNNYFSIYAFDNSNTPVFTKIADSSIVGTQYSQPTYFEFSFEMPFNAQNIYIVNNRDGYYYSYRDIVVTQKVFNFKLWQEQAYKDGYAKAEELYKSQLAQYTDTSASGYQTIYDAGFVAGQNAGLDEFALQYYTFPQLIGAIFDVPVVVLNSLLDFDVFGYSMKNLVFSILTITIILGIVRFILQRNGGE